MTKPIPGRLIFAAFLVLVVPSFASGDPPPSFRSIRGLVLNPDGTPAPYRDIRLVGLARGSMEESPDNPNYPDWHLKTDAQGHFTANLGDFKTWESPGEHPGWGTYVLIAEPWPGDAGGASSHVSNGPDRYSWKSAFENPDEWGTPVDLPREGLDITIQIRKGVTVKGRILDYEHPERPLAGVEISSFNDLHATTHTGRGAEIFMQRTRTNSHGYFVLRHVYPAQLYLNLGIDIHEKSVTWLKTRIAGVWSDDCVDRLHPKDGKPSISIDIQASATPLFRYFGHVTDKGNHSISGAKVTFVVSYHAQEEDWGDNHEFQYAVTDDEGAYEIRLSTPWTGDIRAEARGFAPSGQSGDDAPYAPGKYDFVLTPE